MSTAITKESTHELAPHWWPEQDLVKRTVCPGDISRDEFMVFIQIARHKGLDPLAREIYAIKRGGRLTIQTGIDGYRKIAARTGEYAGNDDIVYDTEDGGHPARATATVYRMVGGMRVAYTATARWREYVQVDRGGNPTSTWGKMPWIMLGKCAESLALRKGFPELAGVYTKEEMDQADNPVVKVETFVPPPSPPREAALPEPKVKSHTEAVSAFAGPALGRPKEVEFPAPSDDKGYDADSNLKGKSLMATCVMAVQRRRTDAGEDEVLRCVGAYLKEVGMDKMASCNMEQRRDFLDRVNRGNYDEFIMIDETTQIKPTVKKVPTEELKSDYTLVDLRTLWATKSNANESVTRIALDLFCQEMFGKLGKNLSPATRKVTGTSIINKSADFATYNAKAQDEIDNAK